MKTLTTAQLRKIAPGVQVTVDQDDYHAEGKLLGLTRDGDGPKVRVLGSDQLERRIPLPATVTVNA